MVNLEYLIQNEYIDVSFGEKLKQELGSILSIITYIKKEINDVFRENKQRYANGKFGVEIFLGKSKEKFFRLINIYEQFLYAESSLIEKVIDIWNEELTDCNSYVEGEYKFLVYATRLEAEQVISTILHNNALIYTSYITDKHTKVYQDREYGLIFDVRKENLLFMSDGDNQTVGFEISLCEYEFSMDNDYFFRENGIIGIKHITHDIGRTYIPKRLLGGDYNEVVLANNRYTIPKAVFIFDDASDFGKIESQKLAEKLDLKLIILRR